jgi:hypothetical protein
VITIVNPIAQAIPALKVGPRKMTDVLIMVRAGRTTRKIIGVILPTGSLGIS